MRSQRFWLGLVGLLGAGSLSAQALQPCQNQPDPERLALCEEVPAGSLPIAGQVVEFLFLREHICRSGWMTSSGLVVNLQEIPCPTEELKGYLDAGTVTGGD